MRRAGQVETESERWHLTHAQCGTDELVLHFRYGKIQQPASLFPSPFKDHIYEAVRVAMEEALGRP